MRKMEKRFLFLSSGAVIAAMAGLLCLLALSGCGHHHKHRHHIHSVKLDQPIEVDEFIGLLGICWPKDWTEAQKADGRRGILEHLAAWESEFGPLLKPAKLIVLLSADEVGGIGLEDRSIILVFPGDCYEFPALFNLLTHHYLDDPQELDPRWQRWNVLGAEVAKRLRDLCLLTQSPTPEPTPEPTAEPAPSPNPTPEPTPDATPAPDDDGDGPDDGDDDEDMDQDEQHCKRLLRKYLKQGHPGLYEWCRGRYGKWWHRHWWKHWRPSKHHKKLFELLRDCERHGHAQD